MKSILFLILFLGFQDFPGALVEYQTSNRLILIFSKDVRSDLYEKELLELARDPLGLDTRDILIFEIFHTGGIKPDGSSLTETEAISLWNYFQPEDTEFLIVLVDKNSKEIYRSGQPIKAAEITDQFDRAKKP